MRILTWIFVLPVAFIAIAFAVANRQPVNVDLWPLPITATLGLYLAVLGSLALGLITGLVMGWASSSNKKAVKARAARKKVIDLEHEIVQLRSQIPAPSESPSLPKNDS